MHIKAVPPEASAAFMNCMRGFPTNLEGLVLSMTGAGASGMATEQQMS